MSKRAFEKVMAGLDDAIAYAKGDESRGRAHGPVDVKAIREASNMTQAAFAETFRLKLGALRDWEQGRRRPDTGSITLLKMIETDPRAVREIIARV